MTLVTHACHALKILQSTTKLYTDHTLQTCLSYFRNFYIETAFNVNERMNPVFQRRRLSMNHNHHHYPMLWQKISIIAMSVIFFGFYDFFIRMQKQAAAAAADNSALNMAELSAKNVEDYTNHLDSLTIVSMNLAGCEPSLAAPRQWNQQRSTDAVRSLILKKNPDVICLQESPGGMTWAKRVFPQFTAIGATYSHANQVLLLVKNGISAKQIPLDNNMPTVMGLITFENKSILVASAHLEPFQRGSFQREEQVLSLKEKAKSLPLIFAGDMNMRISEDSIMEDKLGLLDAWKLAGSDITAKWTWDTYDHRAQGGNFNEYYGVNTREYNTRYDRIYVLTNNIIEVDVPSFELIANQSLTNNRHFLSDHFGMACTLNLEWK